MAQKEKGLKVSERIEFKFSIPKFSSASNTEKMRIVGWSLAAVLLVAFLLFGMLKYNEKAAGLPSTTTTKFPTTATGELKVESQQDVKRATVSVSNDVESLVGSLRELDASLK